VSWEAFPIAVEIIDGQCRQGAEGSLDPIGIAHENLKMPIPIDSAGDVSFILEHIMNK
jgi:hypothetical protein